MAASITNKEKLATWLEEYKVLCADITKRVELQQRNFGMHNLFLSGIAAYLFNFGITRGFENVIGSEVLVLLAVAPFASAIFTMRHIDHDSNIIDKATYIQRRIAPAVFRLTKQDGILGFEKFLHDTRFERRKSVGLLAILGNDHTIILSYAVIYLTSGTLITFWYADFAGSFEGTFTWLLRVFGVLFLAVSVMAFRTVRRYSSIVDSGG